MTGEKLPRDLRGWASAKGCIRQHYWVSARKWLCLPDNTIVAEFIEPSPALDLPKCPWCLRLYGLKEALGELLDGERYGRSP